MSRRMLVLGKRAAAFLGAVVAWIALGASFSGTEIASTSRAEENNFVQELVVLEFIEKDVPQCENTNSLIDEMKRKNYPIQLVERATGGDVLFEQYKIESTPTFVFLVDGKELKRFVVGEESVKDVRDRLLTLFRECRKENGTRTTRAQVSELERFATSGVQNNSSQPKYGRTAPIQTRQNSSIPANVSANASIGGADGVANWNSNVAGSEAETPTARPCLTQVRAFVALRGSNEERIGSGVVVHYNEEYGEALTLVPASLFAGINDPTNMTNTTLDIISSTSGAREKVVGQCVFCDVQSGFAFVAARVSAPVAPVAFLSGDTPRAGESAVVATFNNNNEFVPTKRDILECSFEKIRLSAGDGRDCRGSGVFVARNERLYFAGLYTSNDMEGCGVVSSISLINQTLLSNNNLATVYRDQVSGKYEALSLKSPGSQFSAPLLDSTARVDLNNVDPSTNMSDVFESAEVESDVMNALSKLPTGMENVQGDPSLRLDSPDAPTLDASPVFANSGVANSTQTSVSDVPSVLKKTPDSNVGAESGSTSSNSFGSSISLATNENQALEPRAQEIPSVARGIDGSFDNTNEIRPTNYASRQNARVQTANDQETRLFESSLDELRRLSLEGAEIICIVNWGASSDQTRGRETEVVRLPRRTSTAPTNANNADVAFSSDGADSTWVPEEKKTATSNPAMTRTTTTTGASDLGFRR